MTTLSNITPDGQVTIPRYIMKYLKITAENDLLIEIEDGNLVLRKIRASLEENEG